MTWATPRPSVLTTATFYLNAHLVYESCSQGRLPLIRCCPPTPRPLTQPLALAPQSVHLLVLLILAPHILGEAP